MAEAELDEIQLEQIAALKRHPGWQALFTHMQAQREEKVHALAEKLMRSRKPADQRELDEERGYYLATQFIEGLPDLMAAELKKIHDRRERGDGGEDNS